MRSWAPRVLSRTKSVRDRFRGGTGPDATAKYETRRLRPDFVYAILLTNANPRTMWRSSAALGTVLMSGY